jgi:hypothetical protein
MSDQTNISEASENLDLKNKLGSLYLYLARHLGIQHPPVKIIFTKSQTNADKPFGLTGYYEQESQTVKLYITDRHETDILRSFAHEIIHHWQHERGTLGEPSSQKGYAQTDPNLRKREMEAYLFGNILFRDWQDENRYGTPVVPPTLPQPLSENLALENGDGLRNEVTQFVNHLITSGVLSSYHRNLTSGDMNPNDFSEDLIHKVMSAIEEWTQTINNRGNWENQSNMVK